MIRIEGNLIYVTVPKEMQLSWWRERWNRWRGRMHEGPPSRVGFAERVSRVLVNRLASYSLSHDEPMVIFAVKPDRSMRWAEELVAWTIYEYYGDYVDADFRRRYPYPV